MMNKVEFKNAASIGTTYLKPTQDNLVHFVLVIGGWKELEYPVWSSEVKCVCGCKESAYTPLYEPKDKNSDKRMWMCGNIDCLTMKQKINIEATTTPPMLRRALEWPKFCEINGIGDEHHEVSFDKIHKSTKMLKMLREFLPSTKKFLVLQGGAGLGKTYASMGICELFTRTDDSCIFTTHKKMNNDWVQTFKDDKLNNYIQKITNVDLLVVDDFGITESSPGFMSFFFDLMDNRMQWKKRKTVITTNLDNQAFTNLCGEALTDRLRTGTMLEFTGSSKR